MELTGLYYRNYNRILIYELSASKRVEKVNKYYVYAHYLCDSNELFYIGKGCGNRAYVKNKRSQFWKNITKKHKYRVEIIINNLSESEALIQEILAIKEFKPKANFTKGGEGTSCPNSEKQKQAMRNFWASMSPEEKSKEQYRRSNCRKLKKVKCLNNGVIYESCSKAASDLNIKYVQHVTRVANGNRKHCYGYKFVYVT